MNYKVLAPLVGEPLAAFMVNGENVLRGVLDAEQQAYLQANWQKLPQWLGTENGQIALQTLFEDWRTDS